VWHLLDLLLGRAPGRVAARRCPASPDQDRLGRPGQADPGCGLPPALRPWYWSWTISTPVASGRCTRRSNPPRRWRWPSGCRRSIILAFSCVSSLITLPLASHCHNFQTSCSRSRLLLDPSVQDTGVRPEAVADLVPGSAYPRTTRKLTGAEQGHDTTEGPWSLSGCAMA
jgi:hypothetical protein